MVSSLEILFNHRSLDLLATIYTFSYIGGFFMDTIQSSVGVQVNIKYIETILKA